MARTRKTNSKKPLESVDGRYFAMPHKVVDSLAYLRLRHTAKSLLFELSRQHNGVNNGHLHISQSWLLKRGWKSVATINQCKKDLIESGLIIQTRLGGLNAGPNRYALTWLPISNFVNLDLRPSQYHPGAYLLQGEIDYKKNPQIQFPKRDNSKNGAAASIASPVNGLIEPKNTTFATSVIEDNECLPLPIKT